MNLDEVSGKIANSIRENKKTRIRGYVSFAVRSHAEEIRFILDRTYFKIPDLFRSVSSKLGEEPCNHRNFRTLCDKYCGSVKPFERVNNHPNQRVIQNEQDAASSREDAEERAANAGVSNDSDFEKLGEEWDEILESLGPPKKKQLPLAIKGGLTLDEAKNARKTSTKHLKDIMTSYSRRVRRS